MLGEWLMTGVERLAPEDIRRFGADAARRARIVTIAAGVLFFGGVLVSLGMLTQLRQGEPMILAVAASFAAIGLAALALVFRFLAWRLAGLLICLALLVLPGGLLLLTGAAIPSAGFYLCLLPMLATLVYGPRAGVVFAFGAALLLVGVNELRLAGFEFPREVPAEAAARSNLRGALVFEGIMLIIAIFYNGFRTATLRDVTASEARFRALGARSGDVLLELERDGSVRFASDEDSRALGWEPGGLLGQRVSALVDEAWREPFAEALDHSFERGSSSCMPIRLRRRDGELRICEPHFTAYQSFDGVWCSIVVLRDITERRELESKLRTSQKMDAVGQLASGVAHDFNNLLMVISSYSDHLAAKLPEGDDRSAAEQILRATEQGEALTRQLRAVVGRIDRAPEAIDLNARVRESADMLGRLLGDGVELELALSPALAAVTSDPAHIEQILVNLAANARDAMPEGGRLRIETQVDSQRVVLAVSDSGVGIAPEALDRIFEAFYTSKRRQEGTGLGLYVVYTLVGGMDGEITAESHLGEGTRIEIVLPRAQMQEQPREPAVAPSAGEVAGGDECILVVEDRSELLEAVRHTLAARGYRVLEAGSAEAALALLREAGTPPDLVLSDVLLPGQSGPELERALAAQGEPLPFVFMSGHPDEAAGFGDLDDARLLRKPVRSLELCRRVRQALDEASEGRSG